VLPGSVNSVIINVITEMLVLKLFTDVIHAGFIIIYVMQNHVYISALYYIINVNDRNIKKLNIKWNPKICKNIKSKKKKVSYYTQLRKLVNN